MGAALRRCAVLGARHRDRRRCPRSGSQVLHAQSVHARERPIDPRSQPSLRAETGATLLEEAYEAAESLKQAHDTGELKIEDTEMAETAHRDLDRIFNSGGVAALFGNTYGAAKDVGVYVTAEAIRGLADLEAKERERCATFASNAVAAGLAERTVRVAERQGQLMVEMVQGALREVDLSPEQVSAFKAALARQARELTASPEVRSGSAGNLFWARRACGVTRGTATPGHVGLLPQRR